MNEWIVTDFMEILNIRKLTAAAVAFVLCAAPQTRGVNAYLKETGPSPLRFGAAGAISVSFVLPQSLIEQHTPTNATEIAFPATISDATNAVASQPESPTVPPTHTGIHTTTDPQDSSAPTPSASDMLVVSPQMLTEYFKPVADGTNSAGTVVVPVTVPVGFTPPSATPPSRATYHSP